MDLDKNESGMYYFIFEDKKTLKRVIYIPETERNFS